MRNPIDRTTAAVLGVGLAAWLAGTASGRLPARAAEAGAASPALRHQFLTNLDRGRQPPDARGYLTVTFRSPLPRTPTVLLQCANPRYAAKVHGATASGFVFALYRTRDILRSSTGNPFDGERAARPVTDYRAADNIDLAWVAIADGGAP